MQVGLKIHSTELGIHYHLSSVVDDGQGPVVWTYDITWNEAGYQADNTKGWKGTKSNDMVQHILKTIMIGMVQAGFKII